MTEKNYSVSDKELEKLRKQFSNEKVWEQTANDLARSFVLISKCHDCGAPVVKGYCCTYCGSVLP